MRNSMKRSEMQRLIAIVCLAGSLLCLGGCKGGNEAACRDINDTPLKPVEAEEIFVDFDEGCESIMLTPDYETITYDTALEEEAEEFGLHSGIEYLFRTEEEIFWFKSYYMGGGQYSEWYELYRENEAKDREEIIYKTPDDVLWINEVGYSRQYLYWVEYHEDENHCFDYQVIQFDYGTGEKKILAERDGEVYDEICLSVNNDYVTWYDSRYDSSTDEMQHEIVVYDIREQRFKEIDIDIEAVKKNTPYNRPDIYDNGITFFTQEEENIYVNRLQLDTGRRIRLLIGGGKEYPKLVKCFSTEEYIGWQTDFNDGTFFFYRIKDGKFYQLQTDDKSRDFYSCFYCMGEYIYLIETKSSAVIRYSLDTGEKEQYIFSKGRPCFFRQYAGRIDIDLRESGWKGVSSIDVSQ